jgi:penicillin-binding protein 1A
MSFLFNFDSVENFIYKINNRNWENTSSSEKVEGALVSLEPDTGKIRSMVGGGGFSSENQLNRATQIYRQAGSSFKPFVYAAALDSGYYTAGNVLVDSPIVYEDGEGKTWIPNNYGGLYAGRVTLRQALEKSINIISIKLADTVGINSILDISAKMLHLTDPVEQRKRLRHDLSISLGSIEVSPLEMATAYAMFANGGKDVIPYTIKRVRDRYNHLIEDNEGKIVKMKRANILTPQVSYLMSDLLKGVLLPGGTAYKTVSAFKFDFKAAGKTGTTDNWTDAWFIGFTPELSTAVWVGFDNPAISLGVGNTGGQVAVPIWVSYMGRALEQYKNLEQPEPQGIVRKVICSVSGLLPTSACQKTYEELFIQGSEPVKSCDICGRDEKDNDYEMRDIPTELIKQHKPKYNLLKKIK